VSVIFLTVLQLEFSDHAPVSSGLRITC
jgi:hypothetical protein